MRTLSLSTLCFATGAFFLALAAPLNAQANWYQFTEGDPGIDVYAYMNEGSLMELNEETTSLHWDGSLFTLTIEGREIADLVTFQDEWFRPYFVGAFDANGDPQIEGFVDVFPSGELMIDMSIDTDSRRFQIAGGVVTAAVGCDCPIGSYVICGRSDCQTTIVYCDPPITTKKCTWISL